MGIVVVDDDDDDDGNVLLLLFAVFCLIFYDRSSDFLPSICLFKVRQHVIGCINHDIVVGF